MDPIDVLRSVRSRLADLDPVDPRDHAAHVQDLLGFLDDAIGGLEAAIAAEKAAFEAEGAAIEEAAKRVELLHPVPKPPREQKKPSLASKLIGGGPATIIDGPPAARR